MSEDDLWKKYTNTVSQIILKHRLKNSESIKHKISYINRKFIPNVLDKESIIEISIKHNEQVNLTYQRKIKQQIANEYIESFCNEDIDIGSISGVDNKTVKAMNRGEYPVDKVIDLHGYSISLAYDLLIQEIQDAFITKKRMLLVITGNGSRSESNTSIKSMMTIWLNSKIIRSYILRFSFASKHHGGQGAQYILIRKNNASF